MTAGAYAFGEALQYGIDDREGRARCRGGAERQELSNEREWVEVLHSTSAATRKLIEIAKHLISSGGRKTVLASLELQDTELCWNTRTFDEAGLVAICDALGGTLGSGGRSNNSLSTLTHLDLSHNRLHQMGEYPHPAPSPNALSSAWISGAKTVATHVCRWPYLKSIALRDTMLGFVNFTTATVVAPTDTVVAPTVDGTGSAKSIAPTVRPPVSTNGNGSASVMLLMALVAAPSLCRVDLYLSYVESGQQVSTDEVLRLLMALLSVLARAGGGGDGKPGMMSVGSEKWRTGGELEALTGKLACRAAECGVRFECNQRAQ
jgi:hypothetical protein